MFPTRNFEQLVVMLYQYFMHLLVTHYKLKIGLELPTAAFSPHSAVAH